MTGLFAERNVNIDTWHCKRIAWGKNTVFSLSHCLPTNFNPFQYFCAMAGFLKFSWIAVSLCISLTCFGQTDTVPEQETTRQAPPVQPGSVKKNVSVFPVRTDTGLRTDANHPDSLDSAAITTLVRDSLYADSVSKSARAHQTPVMPDTATYAKFETHPYLPLHATPRFMIIQYHKTYAKDELFYLVAGLVLLLALIRTAFPKYLRNLFLLFFQTSVRQKQTRDQLLQNNLASLVTNFLFVLSGGLYTSLLLQNKHLTTISFWWLSLGSAMVLLLVYLAKYLFLIFAGWVFNSREAAGSYVFVVFMVNKIMAVLLIPFICILAFADTGLTQTGITVSLGMIILLFAYRYWVSFMAVQSKLKVNALHFLLYLCAVELLPLVLIYKVLINYFAGSL